MEREVLLFISLVKSGITGENPPQITEEEAKKIYYIAQKHDLAHIVGSVIEKFPLISNENTLALYKNAIYLAIMRYERIKAEIDTLKIVAEKENVPYILLKGAKTREFYPEPWLRTSCDIDILVKEKDKQRFIKTLINEYGYRNDAVWFHDVSLYSTSEVHVEVHFSIEEFLDNIDKELCNAWEHTTLKEGLYGYDFDAEFFIFYFIAHAYNHFVKGGCGARTILDFWLLKNKFKYDEAKLNIMLERCSIKKFYDTIKDVANVWFEGGEGTQLITNTSEYIINGGVYGVQSAYIISMQKTGGKFKYYFKRLFLPYKEMCVTYHCLKKLPFLLPFCWVIRWFGLLNKTRRGRVKTEIKTMQRIDETTKNKQIELFKSLGII